jgi:hypothetical protein
MHDKDNNREQNENKEANDQQNQPENIRELAAQNLVLILKTLEEEGREAARRLILEKILKKD